MDSLSFLYSQFEHYLFIYFLLLLFAKVCYILSTNKHSKLFSIFINQQHSKFSFA